MYVYKEFIEHQVVITLKGLSFLDILFEVYNLFVYFTVQLITPAVRVGVYTAVSVTITTKLGVSAQRECELQRMATTAKVGFI